MYRTARLGRPEFDTRCAVGAGPATTGTQLNPDITVRLCLAVDGCRRVTPCCGMISKIAMYAARLVCTGTLPAAGLPRATSSWASRRGVGNGVGIGRGAGTGTGVAAGYSRTTMVRVPETQPASANAATRMAIGARMGDL